MVSKRVEERNRKQRLLPNKPNELFHSFCNLIKKLYNELLHFFLYIVV